MTRLQIAEEDLIEKFITGSGRGGQKLHKTASTVYLQHVPSGIQIKCQDTRSQEENRYYARKRLCEKIEEIQLGEKSKQQQLIEKIRRQKRRRSRRSQQKILEEKQHRAQLKQTRKSPQQDNDNP